MISAVKDEHLKMRYVTQDRYGPDGLGSRTAGSRPSRPKIRYRSDRTDFDNSGSDRIDSGPDLGPHQTDARPVSVRSNRPKSRPTKDRPNQRTAFHNPEPDRTDSDWTLGQTEQTQGQTRGQTEQTVG